jgi:hypothetical protein
MDPAAIAAALIGAQMGQQQVAAATAMLRQHSMNSLANVGSGIGTNLNISA